MKKQPEWKNDFPHQKVRESQHKAIEFSIEKIVKENKRFVIIEAGTGVGKSAVGLTIARYIDKLIHDESSKYGKGAYFLTTQKILQEQYIKDFGRFGGKMRSIKSSANYQCRFMKKNTCAESLRALKTEDKSSNFFKSCAFKCTYKKAKEEFLESTESVTNFPYFLAETTYSGKITPRNIMIVDEAHNAAEELSKFIEVSVSNRFSSKVLKIEIPELTSQSKAFKWINEVYCKKLFSHTKHVESMLEKYAGLKEKLNEFSSLAKQYELLDKHACKIRRFLELYDKDNWVYNPIKLDDGGRKIEFKPIDVSEYAEDMLFKHAKVVIMMSATIIDNKSFCKMLGISENDAAFINIPSPFPKDNRPIIFANVGRMSSREIENTLPKLKMAVKAILKEHKGEKGIIHCHSYKIAWFLKKGIKDSRLLIHDSSNREEILKKHINSKQPTVLLSPSMTEGVDLKGDLSRFQVICKVPYPYLGDKLISKKMHKWRWWYPYQTAKTVLQSVGRSVRSDHDHAVTYILDSDWEKFFRNNAGLFSKDFKECIR